MASKKISKTDVDKMAVVVTAPLRAVLAAHGSPHLRGDEIFSTHVNVYFVNLQQVIQLHYYASERSGAGRTPEDRCWHPSFGPLLKPGQSFDLSVAQGKMQLTIS